MAEPLKEFNDFTKKVIEFETSLKVHDKERNLRPVYRGVCEIVGKTCHLQPSLERKSLVKYEYDIIKEMQRLQPEVFGHLKGKSLIEKLRHYEFPTRVLDFSLSPYVALYFALQKSGKNVKNKIYCLAARANNILAETIAQISETAKPYMLCLKEKNPIYIEDILFPKFNDDVKKERLTNFLITVYGKDKKSIFTYPQINTERERNQQSIFMIFSNHIMDLKGKVDFDSDDVEKSLDGQELLKRFVFTDKLFNRFSFITQQNSIDTQREIIEEIEIDASAIKSFQKHLDILGINETFLFPDSIEQTAKQVVRWADNRYC